MNKCKCKEILGLSYSQHFNLCCSNCFILFKILQCAHTLSYSVRALVNIWMMSTPFASPFPPPPALTSPGDNQPPWDWARTSSCWVRLHTWIKESSVKLWQLVHNSLVIVKQTKSTKLFWRSSNYLHLHPLGDALTVLLIIEPNPMDCHWGRRTEGFEMQQETELNFWGHYINKNPANYLQ